MTGNTSSRSRPMVFTALSRYLLSPEMSVAALVRGKWPNTRVSFSYRTESTGFATRKAIGYLLNLEESPKSSCRESRHCALWLNNETWWQYRINFSAMGPHFIEAEAELIRPCPDGGHGSLLR